MTPEPLRKTRSSLIVRSIALVIIVMGLFLTINPARIQAASDLSIEYLAGFAFFKFAKAEPPFRSWVTSSESYRQSNPVERSRMIPMEIANLQNRFANFAVADHPIEIKTRATVKVPTAGLAKRMISEKGFVTIPIKLVDQDDYHFPIQVADMWIALIPIDFEKHLTLDLNAEQYETFKKSAASSGVSSSAQATLNITLLPTQADTTRPLKIKDYELWMLLAEIKNMELWSAKGDKMLWFFEVPGSKNYKSNNSSNVLNLYEN